MQTEAGVQQLEFVYNPMGQRVLKVVKEVSGGSVVPQSTTPWIYTYYAYDANGQVMATYDVRMNTVNTATLDEQMIYGASRLGLVSAQKQVYPLQSENPIRRLKWGAKNYELTNHLGNVNVVITDRKFVVESGAQLYNFFTYDNGTEGWLGGSNVTELTASNGQLNATTSAGSNNFVYKTVPVEAGKTYTLNITAQKGTAPNLEVFLYGITPSVYPLTSGATTTIEFTPNNLTPANLGIIIRPTLTTGAYNYSVQEVSIESQAHYTAYAIMKADYYPFGMTMPPRLNGNNQVIGGSWQTDKYRYAYNGMEVDPETKGNGNSYTTEFRQYDPRLGRWLSLDPLMAKFPWQSPYCAFDNNPVVYTDPMGLEATDWVAKETIGADGTKTNSWQWVDKSYGSLEEAKADGWSDWAGKSAEMSGILNDRAAGGVCNMLLMPEGEFLHWYDNDEVTITANGIPRDNSNEGGTMSNGLLVQDPAGDESALSGVSLEVFDFSKGIGGSDNSAFSEGNATAEQRAEWEKNRANVQSVNDLAEGMMYEAFWWITGEVAVAEVVDKAYDAYRLYKSYKAAKSAKSAKAASMVKAIKLAACFTKGTKISTETGLKNIEEIVVGDQVWAFDETTGDKSLKVVYNTVIKQIDHLERLIVGADTIYTTDDHPFWVRNSWVNAKELQVGDSLQLFSGEKIALSEKTRLDTLVKVYNFAVQDYATYYVSEQQILVHNNNPCAQAVKKTSGWVVKKVFRGLDPAIQKKVASAIEKGIVGPTGEQGIIRLTATEAAETGYGYKIKILGKGGDLRIYGNMDKNGHIVFDKVMGH